MKQNNEYPNGKLCATDEGATSVEIGTLNGAVVLRFPTPTLWIGLPPQDAVDIAQAIIDHAKSISKEPLSITIGGRLRMPLS